MFIISVNGTTLHSRRSSPKATILIRRPEHLSTLSPPTSTLGHAHFCGLQPSPNGSLGLQACLSRSFLGCARVSRQPPVPAARRSSNWSPRRTPLAARDRSQQPAPRAGRCSLTRPPPPDLPAFVLSLSPRPGGSPTPTGCARRVSKTLPLRQVRSEEPSLPPQTFPAGTAVNPRCN